MTAEFSLVILLIIFTVTETTLEELFAEKIPLSTFGVPIAPFPYCRTAHTHCTTWPLYWSAFSRHVKLYYFEVLSTYSCSHSHGWVTCSSLHIQGLFNGFETGLSQGAGRAPHHQALDRGFSTSCTSWTLRPGVSPALASPFWQKVLCTRIKWGRTQWPAWLNLDV